MMCQIMGRVSVLVTVNFVQTSTMKFKWIIPLVFGTMGFVSCALVHYLPDRSTVPLLDSKKQVKKLQLSTVETTIDGLDSSA